MISKNKKGLSGVITAVIMIALVMAVVVILWVVVSNLVEDQLGSVESCFGIYDKVEINEMYTCYDSTDHQVQFSINVGDIDLDGIVVSITGDAKKESMKLTNEYKQFGNYLKNYSDPDFGGVVKIPDKNSGRTYVLGGDFFTQSPDLLEISPIINKNQCDIVDSVSEIVDCDTLA